MPENNLEVLESRNVARPDNASFPMTVASLEVYKLQLTRQHHDLIHDILSMRPNTPDEYQAQQIALKQAIALL